MEAKDVISLPWKKVTDWSELSASNGCWGKCYVCDTDLNVFVENIYRNISRKLNINYEQLKPILVAENDPFYRLKANLFDYYDGYDKNHPRLIELQNTLRVPDISNIEDAVTTDNVSICLKLFEELPDIEKMVFLQKIGKINVKIERFAVQEETTVD